MRPRTAERLADVAVIYRAAIADGKSPVDAVAAKLGITYGAAKMRILRARRAGYNMKPQHRRVFDSGG